MILTEDQTIVDIPVIEVAGFVANYDAELDLYVTVNGDLPSCRQMAYFARTCI
ncbi:hypothetical protein HMSSN139_14940 [Paenibacillus sp. HMSSN-139]|nr:hypothetical protein HMSSN139_14940 [Paenibacillus sp. HMSSN-139]